MPIVSRFGRGLVSELGYAFEGLLPKGSFQMTLPKGPLEGCLKAIWQQSNNLMLPKDSSRRKLSKELGLVCLPGNLNLLLRSALPKERV